MSIPFKFNPLGISGKLRKPLRLTATQDSSSVKLTKTGSPNVSGLKYRLSSSDSWSTYTIDTVIELDKDEYVEFFNSNSLLSNSSSNYVQFVMTGKIAASGNIQSLLNYSNSCNSYCYKSLFQNCTSLINSPELPALKLKIWCYAYMFKNCTSLTKAPELPATTLYDYCYCEMFNNCSSLTLPPELPATILASHCYSCMFQNCVSLNEAPELPATNCTEACYGHMFYGCSSLINPPELPANTLNLSCYHGMFKDCINLTTAPLLSATTLYNKCYIEMFQGCTSLSSASSDLPATTLADSCYKGMFKNCKSLINAPNISATVLANFCCYDMFNGCSLLQSIIVKFSDWGDINATTNWMYNVAQIGTFTKPGGLPEVRGASNIPSGWTIANSYKRDLDYIESTGTQYINLGLTPNDIDSIEVQMKINENKLGHFGCRTDGSPDEFRITLSNNQVDFAYLNNLNRTTNISTDTKNTYKITTDGKFYFNSTLVRDFNQNINSNLNIWLFLFNQNNIPPTSDLNCDIYNVKCMKNGNVIMDLIPVMNNDDIPCMYDKVTATFKYNAGTGQFNYGELPYKFKLNYLEGTGTQYIDTGVTNENATIEITSYGVYSSGCRISYANNEYRMSIGPNTVDSAFGSSVYGYNQTNIGSYKHVFKLTNDGGFYIDNELKYQHQSSISNYFNIYAFAFNNNGTAAFSGNYTSRIYDIKITKNGVLTNHFIPVIDSNGVPAMYDELNGTFKYNAGTGNFNYL